VLDLGRVEEAHVGAAGSGQLDPVGRRGEDAAVFDRLVKCESHPPQGLGDGLGGVAGGGEVGDEMAKKFGCQPGEGNVTDEFDGSSVTRPIGFGGSDGDVDSAGLEVFGVVGPTDAA